MGCGLIGTDIIIDWRMSVAAMSKLANDTEDESYLMLELTC